MGGIKSDLAARVILILISVCVFLRAEVDDQQPHARAPCPVARLGCRASGPGSSAYENEAKGQR